MPEPFHICFTFIGEIQFDSRLLKCAKTLSSSGYQVTAITVGGKTESNEHPGIRVIPISVSQRSRGIVQFLPFYLKALFLCLRTHADCYFASDLYSLPLAFLLAKFRRAKLLYDSRELYSAIAALRHRRLAQRFWSYVEKKIMPSVSTVFTVNESLARIISEQHRIPRPTILFNCPARQEVMRSDRLRKLLSISPERKVILYQGGLQRGRGIFISLRVIRRIHNAALVFLGNGDLRNEIAREIKDERLSGRAYLLDAVPVSELLGYTASADIGVCFIENYGASYYRSLPNKLFEYVAAGVPVVASNFPEMRSFVDSNGVGLCVDPGDEEEIVSAIQRLLMDSSLYQTMVKNCREAGKRYTWENEEAKLVAAVERLKKV